MNDLLFRKGCQMQIFLFGIWQWSPPTHSPDKKTIFYSINIFVKKFKWIWDGQKIWEFIHPETIQYLKDQYFPSIFSWLCFLNQKNNLSLNFSPKNIYAERKTWNIIKILKLYIMLSCPHLYHFFPVSNHYLQHMHFLLHYMWRNI